MHIEYLIYGLFLLREIFIYINVHRDVCIYIVFIYMNINVIT